MVDLLATINAHPVGLLTALIFLPVIGAALICFFRPEQEKQIKSTAIFFSVIALVASLFLLAAPETPTGQTGLYGQQFAAFEYAVLVDAPRVTWCLGVDGISLWLVLLTTLLTPLVLLGSYGSVKKQVREYFVAFLVLEAGIIGALCALDLVIFYAFFELMLIPMYLIIGIWGHERRIYAAVKFFIYTMVGSLLMFVALIYCYFRVPEGATFSFNLLEMYETLQMGPWEQTWVFLAFALGFGIKVPLFPFHTWLPDAHVEAPTGGSVILAGVLLKMGTYGFVRFAIPLFPFAAWYFAPLIMILAVIGIVFTAWMAWVQDDLKKLVAYSSVSHLGFCVLGMFAVVGPFPQYAGLSGSVFIMVSHGLTAAALFFLVGVIYNRRHTRDIEEFGGLAKVTPVFATCFMIATLGSVGLPLTSGFVGEFSTLLGAFNMQGIFFKILTAIAATGVIFGAVYMLQAYRRVFFGEITHDENRTIADMDRIDKLYLVPILALILVFGVFPNIMLDRINPSIERLDLVRQARMLDFIEQHHDDGEFFAGQTETIDAFRKGFAEATARMEHIRATANLPAPAPAHAPHAPATPAAAHSTGHPPH